MTKSRQLEQEADRILRKAKADRLTRRQRAERFDEEAGRAMFARLPGKSDIKPGFDEHGQPVPVVDAAGMLSCPTWESPTQAAAMSCEDAVTFIMGRGPQTSRAIAARAAAAACILGLIGPDRAAKLAKCSVRTIRRLRENVRTA